MPTDPPSHRLLSFVFEEQEEKFESAPHNFNNCTFPGCPRHGVLSITHPDMAMPAPAYTKSNSTGLDKCLEFLDKVKEVLVKRGKQYGDSAFRPGVLVKDPKVRARAKLDDKLQRLQAQWETDSDPADSYVDICGWVVILVGLEKS